MRYCKNYCDNIKNVENYEKAKADNFKGWDCHHRLETHNSDGERRSVDITRKELIALDMYYNRPPEELIFLTTKEHHCLHNKGKPRSEETRKRISEAMKGERNPMYGRSRKGHSVSKETRKRISEALKGHSVSEETKKKKSEALKGKHWKLVDGKRVWYEDFLEKE